MGHGTSKYNYPNAMCFPQGEKGKHTTDLLNEKQLNPEYNCKIHYSICRCNNHQVRAVPGKKVLGWWNGT